MNNNTFIHLKQYLQKIFYTLFYLLEQIFRSPAWDVFLPLSICLLLDLPGTWRLGLEYLRYFTEVQLVINVNVDMGSSSGGGGRPQGGLGSLGGCHRV